MIRDQLRLEALPMGDSMPYPTNWLWESLPAIISWTVLLAPLWLTAVAPVLGVYFVGLTVAYFAVRASFFGIRALINRRSVLRASSEDWMAKLLALPGEGQLDWRECRVTLMIRAFREKNLDMLRATVQSIADSNWDREGTRLRNVEVLFATEENDPYTPGLVEMLAEEFADRVAVRQIKHPKEPGTLPGPSTAMNYAGRILYGDAKRRGVSPRRWIVADFDADTLFHPEYLPCLVYHYVTDSERDFRAYQPVVLFTTDYWKAPLHSRLSALGTSTLTLGWNRRPEIAFTGAAASLAALHSVGFWPTNSHSQDSGVQLRFTMKYGRRFRVTGLPIPLSVYPVMEMGSKTLWREKVRAYWVSCVTLFRQSARWREGPMDEFIESSSRGRPWLALQRLWNGLERDTLTLMPGYGMLVVSYLVESNTVPSAMGSLKSTVAVTLTAVSLLGLLVFWVALATRELVPGQKRPVRWLWELLLFWLVFSVYVPIFTSVAGLKTSTAYAMGKRPRGHFMPTPK